MVRFRFFSRPPGGARPWLAGALLVTAAPAWAASSGAESLDVAVSRELEAIRAEAEGAPRRLPEITDPSVQPVAGQSRPQQQPPVPPQPTAAQLEVIKQLEEMYKRDGRGPAPPMRLKDAPNTRLPDGKLPAPPPGKQFTTPAALQPISAPAASNGISAMPPAPSGSTMKATPSAKPKNRFLSFFTPKSSGKSRNSFLDWLRGGRRSTVASKPSGGTTTVSGGLFAKLLKPFQKDDEAEFATPQAPPAPPPLPELDLVPRYASQPSAPPHTLQPAPARPLVPSQTFAPAAPAIVATPSAPPAASAGREENPFRVEESEFPSIIISPAKMHPLEDEFADIRDAVAPDVTSSAAIDPDFLDEPSNAGGAPVPSGTENLASDDEFGPVQDDFAPEATESPNVEQPAAEQPAAERPAADGKSTAARYAELQRKLAERAGLGGFQGFCPVALRDRRELVDSRPEFVSVYQGRTFELSSAEAKARFDADPTKYAPVNRGNDVVLTARGETDAEGNLHHAVWFKDRLYLFRSPETLKEFNAEPTKYAAD
jgi:YHS domain-containing protein